MTDLTYTKEFEQHWYSLPSYAEKDKLPYYKGWLAKQDSLNTENISYHDVVAFVNETRYEIFNQPWSMLITCTRCSGWEMWEIYEGEQKLIAGEYSHPNFRIEIKGIVICNSANNFKEGTHDE